jgi:hypothetical protein
MWAFFSHKTPFESRREHHQSVTSTWFVTIHVIDKIRSSEAVIVTASRTFRAVCWAAEVRKIVERQYFRHIGRKYVTYGRTHAQPRLSWLYIATIERPETAHTFLSGFSEVMATFVGKKCNPTPSKKRPKLTFLPKDNIVPDAFSRKFIKTSCKV